MSGICIECKAKTKGRGERCRSCSQKKRIVKSSSAKKTSEGLKLYYSKNPVWNKGKNKHIDKRIAKIAKRIPWNKGKTKETDIRIKNISLGNLKVWKNRTPEEKSSHMSKCLDKVAVFPNIPERKLFNIINNIYPNQFKLNVGSKVRIDGLKPDIIHTHKKIIVEMFGDYWHRNDNHKNRINKFNSLGWKCLVIWEKELKNEKVVINKIKEFYNG